MGAFVAGITGWICEGGKVADLEDSHDAGRLYRKDMGSAGRENVKFHVQFYREPWAVFALQHLREEGDVCVFQLTCHKSRTILVRIFRVVPIPMLVDRRPLSPDVSLIQFV